MVDSKKKQGRMIHIRLSEELHKKLRIKAAELDTTIQDLVSSFLEKEMKGKK